MLLRLSLYSLALSVALGASFRSYTLFFLFLVVFGAALAVHGGQLANKLARYEFENRTSGGVVQFAQYEDAQRHTAAKNRSQMYIGWGSLVAVSSAIGLWISIFGM